MEGSNSATVATVPDAVASQEVQEGVVALEGPKGSVAPPCYRVLTSHVVTEPVLHSNTCQMQANQGQGSLATV